MIYIIMCTYNGEKYIDDQLESIERNTVCDWNLYIIDDLSSDSTVCKAERFREKNSLRVKIKVNRRRMGAVHNFLNAIWEVGQHMTNEDVIMLCDQDDVWYSDKIKKTMDSMAQLRDIYGNNIPLLVCTDVSVVNESKEIINKSFRKMNNYNIQKLDLCYLMMENKVQGCTIMINKEVAVLLNEIPTKVRMHDGWLALIVSAFGRIKYIDEPTMMYRQHATNVQGSIEYKDDIKNKFSNLGKQRQIVMDTTDQIKEFIEIYGDRLSDRRKREAQAFASLSQQNFIMRRYNIIRYHMWKSGLLRNIGLMILI